MRHLTCLLALALIFSACTQPASTGLEAVNPLIGDRSFISKYGYSPDAGTAEALRISTHLAYAEELLRKRDVSALSPALQARRAKLLDLLHEYRLAGVFPVNYDHAEHRKPCFIDRDGRICAVGYLVEQTAGRAEAERINAKYKYEELLAMDDPKLDEWIAGSGLTKEEAATIQPTYSAPASNHIKPEYGISSAVLGGANLALAAVNGVNMASRSGSWAIPIVSLATGVGQVFLGALNFPKETEQSGWYGGTTTNESQKVVSMVNIGIGTTGIVLSAWNLLSQRAPRERRSTWNIHSFPTTANRSGLALSYTRRF